MRYFFLFFLPVFIAEPNWAQPHSPAVQVQFYFEDALGNKDTIMVSGDTLLIPGQGGGFDYSAYRGDTVIAPDPKKKFEVFTMPVMNVILSKLVFTPYVYYEGLDASKLAYYKNVVINYGDSLYSIEGLFLLFKCKNYPITVKWEYTYYASLPSFNMMAWSHLVPDHSRYSSPDIFPGEHYTITKFKCLRYDGIWTFHLGNNEDYNRPWQKVFGFFNPQDTLYGLLLNFSPYFNCSEVSGGKEQAVGNNKVVFSPNPTGGELRWSGLPAGGTVTARVYDALGRLRLERETAEGRVDLGDLTDGVYFVALTDGSGRTVAAKAVVLVKNK